MGFITCPMNGLPSDPKLRPTLGLTTLIKPITHNPPHKRIGDEVEGSCDDEWARQQPNSVTRVVLTLFVTTIAPTRITEEKGREHSDEGEFEGFLVVSDKRWGERSRKRLEYGHGTEGSSKLTVV
ncbi:hypothetical protein V6N13_108742 [Hibiscus sabdariffa]|uniref:Uncharacterized protein n=1 Tax=Hibiscus sabdariffa TaxID=183260 RepID=A0ABR2ST31_9ROSI